MNIPRDLYLHLITKSPGGVYLGDDLCKCGHKKSVHVHPSKFCSASHPRHDDRSCSECSGCKKYEKLGPPNMLFGEPFDPWFFY